MTQTKPKPEKFSLPDNPAMMADEAEASCIGSMIIDDQIIDEVAAIVRPEMFRRTANQVIVGTIFEMREKARPIDIVTIQQSLRDASALNSVGGVQYLLDLGESVPSSASAAHYAAMVKAAHLQRLRRDVLLNRLMAESDDPAEMIEADEAAIAGVSSEAIGQTVEAENIAAAMQIVYDHIQAGEAPKTVATGLYELDEKLGGGLRPGELIIIGARPGMGKSGLLLNFAENMSNNGEPVGIFTLEMSKQELAMRLISSRLGVDLADIRKHRIHPDDLQRVADAITKMNQQQLLVNDDTRMFSMIRAKARKLVKQGAKALFIDYLQLVMGPKTDNREQEIAAMSRGFKLMARELGVPMVVLCQLNRLAEGRENHRPRMSDLRESGAIEQDADVVILLHREDYYKKHEPGYVPSNIADIIIAKQRNGAIDDVQVSFDGKHCRFHDLRTY